MATIVLPFLLYFRVFFLGVWILGVCETQKCQKTTKDKLNKQEYVNEANANFTGPGLGEYSLAHWLEFRKNLRRVTLVVLPNAS